MLSWFFRRRQEIFRYWDGQKWKGVDPLIAWRAMWEDVECQPYDDFGPAVGRDKDGQDIPIDYAAQDRVVAMAQRMFDVRAWSNEQAGLTVSETLTLLWRFLDYMNRLKKKRDISRMPSAPTVSGSSPPDNSITPPASGSSSINPASKSDDLSSSSKRSLQL